MNLQLKTIKKIVNIIWDEYMWEKWHLPSFYCFAAKCRGASILQHHQCARWQQFEVTDSIQALKLQNWAWKYDARKTANSISYSTSDNTSPKTSKLSMKIWCLKYGQFNLLFDQYIKRKVKSIFTSCNKRHYSFIYLLSKNQLNKFFF